MLGGAVMRVPDVLSSLVDQGVIERVVRPLMSGKEAQIYLVVAGGAERVAKIYKEANQRTFKHRAEYTEGRKVRNSRDQRAMGKRSQHGRAQDEVAWRATEVDMIYRLRDAGVRVPAPYNFIDGVLIMELVTDRHGEPAARLGEIDFEPREAKAIYERLIQDVVRMLCAGVVHGDLSDFNVLLGGDGPVIIDFPQAVDPSKNQSARRLLLRDVENLHRFYGRFDPIVPRLPYAEEMWALYESNRLTPETRLQGQHRSSQKKANVAELLDLVGEVNEDERRRRRALGRDAGAVPDKPRRVEVVHRGRAVGGQKPSAAVPSKAPPAAGAAPSTPRPAAALDPERRQAPARRRRRRRPPQQAAPQSSSAATRTKSVGR
jgi:RIO kinase 1